MLVAFLEEITIGCFQKYSVPCGFMSYKIFSFQLEEERREAVSENCEAKKSLKRHLESECLHV